MKFYRLGPASRVSTPLLASQLSSQVQRKKLREMTDTIGKGLLAPVPGIEVRDPMAFDGVTHFNEEARGGERHTAGRCFLHSFPRGRPGVIIEC